MGDSKLTNEPKIIKVSETPNYKAIFTVNFPVKFYFLEDNKFDGISGYVANLTENEQELFIELCEMLAKALKHEYVVEEDDDI